VGQAKYVMENPRLVKGCVLGLFDLMTCIILGLSICFKEPALLTDWLGGIAVVLAACVVLQFGVGLVFMPILWVLSKLTGCNHGSEKSGASSDSRAEK